MTLTFLGQAYEANTAELAPTKSELVGMYRGIPVKFSNSHTVTRSHVTLTYRGTRYTR